MSCWSFSGTSGHVDVWDRALDGQPALLDARCDNGTLRRSPIVARELCQGFAFTDEVMESPAASLGFIAR